MLALFLCCILINDDKAKGKNTVTVNTTVKIYRAIEVDQVPAIGSSFYLAEDKSEVSKSVASNHLIAKAAYYLDEIVKSGAARDQQGIRETVEGGKAFTVKGPATVKILDVQKRLNGLIYVEVRVINGDEKYIDKKGWVLNVMLSRSYEKPVTYERPLNSDENKERQEKQKEKSVKAAAESEAKAADLLKHAKRWLDEGDKDNAMRRLDDLLKRFPESKAAPEAKKLKEKISK